jgi:hypothetical protein
MYRRYTASAAASTELRTAYAMTPYMTESVILLTPKDEMYRPRINQRRFERLGCTIWVLQNAAHQLLYEVN